MATGIPNTLRDSLARSDTPAVVASTLLVAFNRPGFTPPQEPLTPHDINPDPRNGTVTGNPQKGLSRLPFVRETPAKKHGRLYPVLKHPVKKTEPYKPAMSFRGLAKLDREQTVEVYGNPNTKAKVDRSVRSTARTNIRAQHASALIHLPGAFKPRLEGFAYIRSRKSSPRTPLGTRTSLMVNRDLRLTGKFPGTNNTPASVADTIKPVPTAAIVATNRGVTGAASTYSAEDAAGVTPDAGTKPPAKKGLTIGRAIVGGLVLIGLVYIVRRGI